METESAFQAQRSSSARGPNGLRRLSLAMLATGKLADDFTGTPGGQGATRPGQVLCAFKAAAPYLGFGPRVVHAIDWLFTFTQPQDWIAGSRPIVWPSAALAREALGLGVSQTKTLNRHLVELGLLTMKDSPNGKRYGKRDKRGHIVEAYGFDLSPLFARMDEFQAVAEKGRELREHMRRLRRRASIARNGLVQILETVAEQGLRDAAWQKLESDGMALARSLRGIEHPEEMELGVETLERRQREARERLEGQLAVLPPAPSEAVDSDPMGPENRPHQYNYKRNSYPQEDNVTAYKESRGGADNRGHTPNLGVTAVQQGRKSPSSFPPRRDSGSVLGINTDELVKLAPKLRSYLRTSAPAWPDIVDAADWLRHDLGISKPLWGEACLAMGREQAAIALAIVSAKPVEHFTASPGSYFFGMVTRAQAGELNLSRTIWGIRSGTKTAGKGRPQRPQSTHFHKDMNS